MKIVGGSSALSGTDDGLSTATTSASTPMRESSSETICFASCSCSASTRSRGAPLTGGGVPRREGRSPGDVRPPSQSLLPFPFPPRPRRRGRLERPSRLARGSGCEAWPLAVTRTRASASSAGPSSERTSISTSSRPRPSSSSARRTASSTDTAWISTLVRLAMLSPRGLPGYRHDQVRRRCFFFGRVVRFTSVAVVSITSPEGEEPLLFALFRVAASTRAW